MTAPRPSTTEALSLATLGDRLAAEGYGEYYACFNPLAPRLSEWERRRSCLPVGLRALVELFLLGQPIEANTLPFWALDLVPLLESYGIVRTQGDGRLSTRGFVILPVAGNWLICQRPQINPTLYFGDDSMALLMRTMPRAVGETLDLCAGPGVQALHSARFAARAVAVEINPVAADLCRLNARLNRLNDRLEVFTGDLFKPVAGRRFDSVTANPPLLPFPDGIAYPFVGHGGPDGLRITHRILDGLPEHLTRTGAAQIVGTTLSDGLLPLPLDALEESASRNGLRLRMSVLAHQPLHPGSDYFDGLVSTAVAATGLWAKEVSAAVTAMLKKHGATHLCSFYLHAAPAAPGLELLDVADEKPVGLWYV